MHAQGFPGASAVWLPCEKCRDTNEANGHSLGLRRTGPWRRNGDTSLHKRSNGVKAKEALRRPKGRTLRPKAGLKMTNMEQGNSNGWMS